MKTINQLICLFTAAILLVGCDNYLDVNEDPNNPLIENVAPNLLLAGAQTTTGSIFATRLNRLAEHYLVPGEEMYLPVQILLVKSLDTTLIVLFLMMYGTTCTYELQTTL
jgi:hypothetical protein